MPGVEYWTGVAAKVLVGRTVAKVEYVDWGEGECGLMLTLDNGTEVTAARDDEGNGPGALHTNRSGAAAILPVIRRDR